MKDFKYYIRLILNIILPIVSVILALVLLPKLVLFFLPFVLGYFVAFLANPIIVYLQKRGNIKRKYFSMIVTLTVLAFVILILYGVAVLIFRAASSVVQMLPGLADEIILSIDSLMMHFSDLFKNIPEDTLSTIEAEISNIGIVLQNLGSKITKPAVDVSLNAVKSVPSLLFNSLIFFLSAFCFITEWENIQAFIKRHTPAAIERYLSSLKADLKKIFGSWLLAQGKIMILVFGVLFIGLTFIKVKYAFPISIFTAMLDVLPAFGVGFVLWPWALLEVFQGEFLMALWLMLIYVATQLVRHTLQPKIMGDTMGLPPLWTLLFLYIGFKFYGLAGMIFAVPVGMFILSLVRYGVFDRIINSAKIIANDFIEFFNQI